MICFKLCNDSWFNMQIRLENVILRIKKTYSGFEIRSQYSLNIISYHAIALTQYNNFSMHVVIMVMIMTNERSHDTKMFKITAKNKTKITWDLEKKMPYFWCSKTLHFNIFHFFGRDCIDWYKHHIDSLYNSKFYNGLIIAYKLLNVYHKYNICIYIYISRFW